MRPPVPLFRETYPFRTPYPSILPLESSPMAIEAQPIADIPPATSDRASSAAIHPRYSTCVPVVLSCVVQSVIIIYIYIFLCAFHLLYSSSIRAISLTANNSSEPSRWEALLRSVTKICYTTLATGLSCLCIGAYITQNSYESTPATWGLVLMIAGVDALLNMLAILACISATVTPPQAANLDERSVRRVARIFAVPVSSLIWSIIFAIIAVIFYCEQSKAPQLDLAPYLMVCKSSDAHGTQNFTQDRNQTVVLPPIAGHPFPTLMRVGVGLMIAIVAIRFVFVVFSIMRLQDTLTFHPVSGTELHGTDNTDSLSSTAIPLEPLGTSPSES